MDCKKKILVVEDNCDCRELIVFVLKRSSFEVVKAANGLEAIDQARATHPDLILMDLGLPKMTGDEATILIKADPDTKHIPVIVNTAFHKGAFVERAIAAGAAEILHKPVDLKVLLGVVRRYLSAEEVGCGVPMNSTSTDFQPAAVSP